MARVAFLTQGKAGSQWIADVLSDPRILAFVPSMRFMRATGPEYRMSDWAREGDNFFAGPIFSVAYQEWEYFRRPGDKAIWVIRDPRDSLVSWAFSIAYSHFTEPHVQLIREPMLSLSLRGKLLLAMYTHWEVAWIIRSWAGRKSTASEYPATYERLIADEYGQFGAMFDFLGWSIPQDVLREVVDSLAFRRRSGGRDQGELNIFSHYRRGVAGDWKNYFDRRLGWLFEVACPRLLIELGYETSESWWEALPATNDALAADDRAPLEAARIARLEKERDAFERGFLAQNELVARMERLLESAIADVVEHKR